MTSFSSSGISGSSNVSFGSGQDPHHPHTPMRVHFTDGSVAGSSIMPSKQEITKVGITIMKLLVTENSNLIEAILQYTLNMIFCFSTMILSS